MIGPRHIAALLAALCLAACGSADNDPGPGGVTVSEAQALDEAAEMIEQRRLPEEALEPPASEERVESAPTTQAPQDAEP